jgi:hypothetical protein
MVQLCVSEPKAHIHAESMKEVVTQYDAFFTPTEEDHLHGCKECLAEFEKILWDSPYSF